MKKRVIEESGLLMLKDLLFKAKEQMFEFVICFIDINELKEVNDNFGNSEGDFYIQKVCSLIETEKGENDVIFRMGGDEFVIVFPNKTQKQVETI